MTIFTDKIRLKSCFSILPIHFPRFWHCAMQIMWAIQRATFSKMLLNTNTQQLGNIFFKLTAVATY